jgi:hypothetical protein
MKELNLTEAMGMISYSNDFSGYMSDICKDLCEKGTSVDRKTIDNILVKYGVRYKDIKEELLDIIVFYAMIIVTDGIISPNESFNIKYLKRLFKIKEGDLYKLKNNELKEIIQQQLYKLYIDNTIDEHEALFKVELQELFDLSYEQMSVFVNPLAYDALERGANLTDLDTVFPNFHPSKKDYPSQGT